MLARGHTWRSLVAGPRIRGTPNTKPHADGLPSAVGGAKPPTPRPEFTAHLVTQEVYLWGNGVPRRTRPTPGAVLNPYPPASKNSFALLRTRPACSTTTTPAPRPLATTIAYSLHVQAVRPMALRPGAAVRLASNARRNPVRALASLDADERARHER